MQLIAPRWLALVEEDAKRLADEKDKSKFEEWALRRVGAERGQGKGADRGIDGRRYFHDEPNGPTRLIVVSVKTGTTHPRMSVTFAV